MSIVDITTAWNNTGVNLEVGDTVLIFVDGIAATDGALHNKTITWIGPEGMGGWIGGSSSPLPGAAAHSVIGKIGDSGTPFYVGRNGSFIVNVAGQLFLGLNDDIFWDNYGYYVAFISIAKHFTTVDVADKFNSDKIDFSISQNYPNPFNPSTNIEFKINSPANVKINIYDINGQLICNLVNEELSTGVYTTNWDGTDSHGNKISSGTYFYRVEAGSTFDVKKMILLK